MRTQYHFLQIYDPRLNTGPRPVILLTHKNSKVMFVSSLDISSPDQHLLGVVKRSSVLSGEHLMDTLGTLQTPQFTFI